MATVLVMPAASDSLARMIDTHRLPANTVERFTRSIARLAVFPMSGHALRGQAFDGLRLMLGPWPWMLVVYRYIEVRDTVEVIAVEDARTSDAATNYRA